MTEEADLNARFNILPDPRFSELKAVLEERLAHVVGSIQAHNFAALLDPVMRQVLEEGFAAATAQEGTIWLVDEASKQLIPAYNTGPNADQLVGKFPQPLRAGLISMVFASEQPFVENEVSKNAAQSKGLDNLLRVETYAMIAVPLYFLKACRGVVSCVQLKSVGTDQPDPAGFAPEHLAKVQRAATLLGRLLDLRLLSSTVDWTSE